MHEFGIASDVLEAADVEAARIGGGRLAVIGVTLGGGSGVDPDALRTSFEALVEHRGLDGLVLEIQEVAARRACRCGLEYEVTDLMAVCPGCGSLQSERVPGPGLDISFLEFADEIPPGTG